MSAVFARLGRWWYDPAPAERLGVLRALIGLYALWYVSTRRGGFADSARSNPGLYAPVGVFRVLGGPLDAVVADGMVWLTLIFGVLFILGAFHRYVGPLFGILLTLTLMYSNSWSMIYHMDNALVIHVLILGFTNSAAAVSIDRHFASRAGATAPEPADTFGWPIKLICAVTAAGYFLAGYAKLAGPHGIAWASGLQLREQVAADLINKEVFEGGGMPLAYAIWDHVWLFTVLGVGTVVLELGAPLFLLGRRAGRLWAVATWAMHWGIFLIMGIKFRYQLAFFIFLPFFNVERIATAFRTGPGKRNNDPTTT